MLELIQPRRAREDWLKKPRQFLLAWLRPSHQSPSQASGRRLTQLAPNFSRNSHQENTNCDSVRLAALEIQNKPWRSHSLDSYIY